MNTKQITRIHTVDNGTLDFDAFVPCIIATNIGFMNSDEFRGFMESGLKLIREKIKEYGKVGWLADISKADIFFPKDVAWTSNYWNVMAYEAGLKYCAFVMPESIFVQLTMEEYTVQTTKTKTIVINHFKDQASAKAWLHEVLSK